MPTGTCTTIILTRQKYKVRVSWETHAKIHTFVNFELNVKLPTRLHETISDLRPVLHLPATKRAFVFKYDSHFRLRS